MERLLEKYDPDKAETVKRLTKSLRISKFEGHYFLEKHSRYEKTPDGGFLLRDGAIAIKRRSLDAIRAAEASSFMFEMSKFSRVVECHGVYRVIVKTRNSYVDVYVVSPVRKLKIIKPYL